MHFKDGIIFGSVLASGLLFSSAAFACSTDGWNGGVVGLDTTLFVASPPNFPRYSEFCGMNVTGTGSVRDLSPNHDRIRARFYYLSQLTGGSGDAVLFRAYANESDGSPLFEIRRNDGNLVFDATDATGGSTSFASPSGWVAIEFDWDSVGGDMDIWVNADATSDPATATISAGTGTVDSVRLGLVDGLGGFGGGAIFDAYEAHSTTAVGLLNKFDADGNSSINVLDAVAQINEINEISLAAGQPDCNLSGGNINVLDAVCIINYINAQ